LSKKVKDNHYKR